jgi:signal peptidase I
MRRRDWLGMVRRGFMVIVLSTGIAVVLFHFVFQPFQVAGLSMSPTLGDRDYLLVDRVFFREGSLHRGDLVVFNLPDDPRYLVKRIAGLPGEKIAIRNGRVVINDHPLPRGEFAGYPKEDFGPLALANDQYFCLGDNPRISLDSRTLGPIDRSAIYGRVLLRYLPMQKPVFLGGRPAGSESSPTQGSGSDGDGR